MSYETHTWESGETITAEKLNHMEDGIEECCGDKGYECIEERVTLTDESVTTEHPQGAPEGLFVGNFAYSTPITADTIKVTFNGVEYTCQKSSTNEYGAPFGESTFDWSEYPFHIGAGEGNVIITETAGTYRVKIEALEETVEASDCFKKAVNKVATPSILVVDLYSLGTPTADGLSSERVNFTDCDSDEDNEARLHLWEGVDSYAGQPLVVQNDNSYSLASGIEQYELCACAYTEEADGNKLGLEESTLVLHVYENAEDEQGLLLVSPNTKFYRHGSIK